MIQVLFSFLWQLEQKSALSSFHFLKVEVLFGQDKVRLCGKIFKKISKFLLIPEHDEFSTVFPVQQACS